MTRYKLKLERYVLPDAIKKSFKSEELEQSEKEKDYIENRIKEINTEMNDSKTTKERKIELEKELYSLDNRLTTINNNIFNIKADIYGSIVNFNNANISQLSTNISNIESVIKDPSKFNKDISDNISKILASQTNINKIFENADFKALLKEIKNKIPEENKINFQEEFNKLNAILEEIKNNPKSSFENQQIWKQIKDDLKDLIKTEDLMNIINEFSDRIIEIVDLKKELNKMIFKTETADNISEKELSEYIKKFRLLSDLYDTTKNIIENKELKEFGLESANVQQVLKVKDVDEFKRIINNLREWFSNNNPDYKKVNQEIMISNMSADKLLNNEIIKKINSKDIEDATFLIERLKPYKDSPYVKGPSRGKNKNEEQNDTQNKDINKGQGLDLDEIHNMNIMNNIIKSLDNIIYNQNRIIELLMYQNQSKQSSPQMKLGRFKVEKYNPNMSITEFKKLFSKLD